VGLGSGLAIQYPGWTYTTRDTTVAGVALVSLWNASSV